MAYTPSVADVAALIPQRTGDANGTAQGTFNSSTVPTDTQVTDVITNIVAEVGGIVGAVPVSLESFARRVVSLGSAAQVEESFFPDQGGFGSNAAAVRLYEWYQQALAQLRKSVADVDAGGDVGGVDDVGTAQWSFPDPALIPAVTPWTQF